jgi:hypothetical protein
MWWKSSLLFVVVALGASGLCGAPALFSADYNAQHMAASLGHTPLVIVTSRSWCIPCRYLEAWLDKEKIPYVVDEQGGQPPFPHTDLWLRLKGKWQHRYVHGYDPKAMEKAFQEIRK